MAVLAYTYPQDAASVVGAAASTLTMYSAASGTVLANVTDTTGTALVNSVVTLDVNGLLPPFTCDQPVIYAASSATAMRGKVKASNLTNFPLLTAVSATGPSAAVWSPGVGLIFAQVTMAGAPTAVTVNIEQSFDQVTWFTAASLTGIVAEYVTVSLPSVNTYVRANLVTLTGGTTPTVTVKVFK